MQCKYKTVVLWHKCGAEAARVSGTGVAAEDASAGAGRSNCCSGSGDGWRDSENHPQRV